MLQLIKALLSLTGLQAMLMLGRIVGAAYTNTGLGGERFWPASNDFPLEIEKCVRILRSFTSEGVQVKPDENEGTKHRWKLNPPKVT